MKKTLYHHHRAGSCTAALLGLTLLAATTVQAQNGTWINDAGGSWTDSANWAGGTIADGADNTADFSTLDLTNDISVTLDGARTIGSVVFDDTAADTNGYSALTIDTGTGDPLTFDGASPSVSSTNGSGGIATVIAGINGLTKTGPGIVGFYNNANTIGSNIVVAEGVLFVDGPNNSAGTILGAISSTTNRENQTIVLDGATLAIASFTRFVNGAAFQIAGDGVGGTNGAMYSDVAGAANNTRLQDRNGDMGPQIDLATNATIRIDGTPGDTGDQFICDGFAMNGHTLTKTGDGTLFISSQQGADNTGAGLIHLKEGQIGTRQNSFGSGRDVLVDQGAYIAPVAGGAFPAANRSLTNNGLVSLNSRNNAVCDQTVSLLYGSGLITCGENSTVATLNTLTVGGNYSTNGNSFFSGNITNEGVMTLALTKTQTNTLTLSGNLGYDGVTTVNEGALMINGVHTGTGGFTVNFGGTLGGIGTLSSSITNGGTIASGDPAAPGGTLTVLGNILGNFTDAILIANSTLAVSGKIGPDYLSVVGSMSLSNGTLELPLDLGAVSASVSTFNVDAASTLAFTAESPATGTFPLISYGSLGGAVGFAGLSLTAPVGVTATLVNNAANSTIDVVITSVPALTWNGNVNGDWDLGITANWKGAAVWSEPNGAIFNDTAAGTTAVNVTTTVTPDAVVVNNPSKPYSFSGAGDITGAAALVKNGSGTLTVANNNTFSGSVALNAGILRVGDGGTSGSLGSGDLINAASLVMNRTDDFTLGNTVTLSGFGASLTKEGTGTAIVPLAGTVSGVVTVNGGTLAVAPSGSVTISSAVTGSGAFGVVGSGTAILSGYGNSWSGGTVISNGTLRFGDEFGLGAEPPPGDITNDGTLTLALSTTLANNVSGSGGVSVISNTTLTFSGVNTYTGPTFVEGTLTISSAASYPAQSELQLGNVEGGLASGTANFSGFNPVTGGLKAGSSGFPGGSIHLGAGSSSLTVNGDVLVGVAQPGGASVTLTVADDEVLGTKSMSVVTNGGTIQIGYNGTTGNSDGVLMDVSALGSFYANLGTNGFLNLGSVNSGNPPGTPVPVDELRLASVSNLLAIGTINIGAGQRRVEGQLTLGAGTNVINTDTLNIGSTGRDWGRLFFQPAAVGSGSLRLRAYDGVSRANMGLGDTSSGTGAPATNLFNVAGNYADLLIDQLVIGNEPTRNGVWEQIFNFDQGILDALSVSISAADRNDGAHGTDEASSTVNLGGGTVTFGPVGLVGDSAAGTLNVTGGSFTAASITDSGVGTSTFNLSAPTFTLDLVGFGNPATAPVVVDNFNPSGAVNLQVNATGLAVGQFELIKYGTLGGTGFGALNLVSLPASVVGSLSNNVANSSVDLVITSAPFVINPIPTNIVTSVTGNQLDLSWPADHIGWDLQSNSVNVADSGAWFLVPGSSATNQVILTIDPTETNVFFRMFLP